MDYLQELSSGDAHIAEAQRLWGELARTRVCLLAAESKARYDAEIVSTRDSLPEAEEAIPESSAVPEFDSADRGAATPRRSATRRSGGKKRTSTARRSGRRSPSTPSGPRGTAEEEEEVATPTGASSLQVKLAAAVIPGVVVVVIGIIWMVAGGDSSSKKSEQKNLLLRSRMRKLPLPIQTTYSITLIAKQKATRILHPRPRPLSQFRQSQRQSLTPRSKNRPRRLRPHRLKNPLTSRARPNLQKNYLRKKDSKWASLPWMCGDAPWRLLLMQLQPHRSKRQLTPSNPL